MRVNTGQLPLGGVPTAGVLVLGLMVVLAVGGESAAVPPELVGYDPAGQIRFATPAQADAKRQELVDFIWSGGLPTTAIPVVATGISFPATDLAGVNQSLVSRIDRMAFNINVADHQLPSIAYLISPTTAAATPRLGIVHQGHQAGLAGGLDATTNYLLGEGIHVVAMNMPLLGWNGTVARRTMTLPNGSTTTLTGAGSAVHNALFNQFAGALDGGLFAYFQEPVVQSVNYFVSEHPDTQDVTMIGLSGGGWTTHMAAAIDTRINQSFPVAGALPLYARPFSAGSAGDAEQNYEPLFREIDSAGDGDAIPDAADGVASWLEIFALGGYGSGRRQIQVLNFNDSCCFGGDVYETYDDFVSDQVDSLGQGDWDFHSDTTHSGHQVSTDVLNNVIGPALDNPPPTPEPASGCLLGAGLIVMLATKKRRLR